MDCEKGGAQLKNLKQNECSGLSGNSKKPKTEEEFYLSNKQKRRAERRVKSLNKGSPQIRKAARVYSLIRKLEREGKFTQAEPHGVTGDISNAAKTISDTLDEADLPAAMTELRDCARAITEAVKTTADEATGLLKKLGSTSTLMRIISYVSVTFGQILCAGKHGLIFTILEFIKLMALFVPDNMGTKLYAIGKDAVSKVQTYFGTPSPAKQKEGYQAIPHGVVDVLTYCVHNVAAVMLGKDVKEIEKKGSLVALGEAGRSISSLNAGIKTIGSWIMTLIEGLGTIFHRFVSVWLVSKNPQAHKFMEGVTEILGVDPETSGTAQFAEKFMRLRSDGLSLKNKLESGELNEVNKVGRVMLTRNIDLMLKYYTTNAMTLHTALKGREARPTPCFIQFAGKPGKGKSTVLMPLARVLTDESNCGRAYDTDNLAYPVSDTKYRDGYTFQKVWIHDDQWSQASGTSADDEYKNILTMISNVPLAVDMASIERKGAPFVCDLYLGSTNNPYPKPSSCINYNALWRRRQELILVTSTNWHDPMSLRSSEIRSEGFETMNNLYFKFVDVNKEIAWQNEIDRADAALARGEHPGPDWISWVEMAKRCVKTFNRHYSQADPGWLFSKTLPAELKNLAHMEESESESESENTTNKWCNLSRKLFGEKPIPRRPLPTIEDEKYDSESYSSETLSDFVSDVTQPKEKEPERWSKNKAIMVGIFGTLATLSFIFGMLFMIFKVSAPDIEETPWNVDLTIGGTLWTVPESHKEQFKAAVKKVHADWTVKDAKDAGKKADEMEAHLKYDNSVPTRGRVNRARVVPHSGTVNLLERARVVKKNLVHVRYGPYKIFGLGLCGNQMIINDHFMQQTQIVDGFVELIINRTGHDERPVFVEVAKMRRFEDDDIVVIELPSSENSFRDILSYFATERSVKIVQGDGALLLKDGDDIVTHLTRFRKAAKPVKYGETDYMQLTAIEYNTNGLSLNGRCMSPLFDLRDCSIIGLHCAGTTDKQIGFSKPVTMEYLQSLLKEDTSLLDNTEVEIEAHCYPGEKTTLDAIGALELVGKATKDLEQPPAMRSKIIRSPIHGVFPVKFGPSVLNFKSDPRVCKEAKMGRSPHQTGLDKFSRPVDPFHPKYGEIASAAILARLRLWKGLEKRILTDDEVLNGLPDKSLKRVELLTSAGWPWKDMKLKDGRKGKQVFIRNLNEGTALEASLVFDENEYSWELQRVMKETEMQIRRGEVPLYLAYENLKDELRSLEKIKFAKTRTFDCLPLHILLLTRKYFGMFIAAAHRNCAKSVISVGINATGADWTIMANRLNRFGDNLIAGDYKEWDGTVLAEEMMAACEIINKAMNGTEEENRARSTLMYTFIHTYIVSLDTVVRKHQGMPSGVALTAVLNSLVNWYRLIVLTAQIVEEESRELIDADTILTEMDMVTYGDDHVITVSDKLKEFVSFRSLKQLLTRHRFGYTDALKTGVDYDHQKLEDVTYLKRSFKPYRGGLYLAPLELSSVLRSVNWQNKNPLLPGLDMLACIKMSFRDELALHGRGAYEYHVKEYNEAVADVVEEIEANDNPFIASSFNEMVLRIDGALGQGFMSTQKIDDMPGSEPIVYLFGDRFGFQKFLE